MPRVKIDYVVSFSSEDPEHPASNLLAEEISRRRWVCGSKGEASCSVVLQLARSVRVGAVHVGSHDSALVEVLVGRSETPQQPYQVLVLSSVFMSPAESKRGPGVSKVRTFGEQLLAADTRSQHWDRVRVVCLQPYNKHVKYGLSFIHIFEPETAGNETPTPASGPIPAPALPPAQRFQIRANSSDEDEAFKPGELFAKVQSTSTLSVDAQIRQASKPSALKNTSQKAKAIEPLPKTISDRHKSKHLDERDPEHIERVARNRDSLIYKDEKKPNDRIDKIIQRDREEKEKNKLDNTINNDRRQKDKENDSRPNETKTPIQQDKSQTPVHESKHRSESHSKHNEKRDNTSRSALHGTTKHRDKDRNRENGTTRDSETNNSRSRERKEVKNNEITGNSRSNSNNSKDSDKHEPSRSKQSKKRAHSSEKHRDQSSKPLRAGPRTTSPHRLLADVVFVLSGYQNPQRGAIRDKALACGARYRQDWGPGCTHLICAFPSTPKLRAVRSSDDGAIIVRGEWVEECCRERRRVPWQWHATEPERRQPRSELNTSDHDTPHSHSEECDTDDEIQKVLKKQKNSTPESMSLETMGQRNSSVSPSRRTQSPSGLAKTHLKADSSHDSDVSFVRDERYQGQISLSDSETDSYTDEETGPVETDAAISKDSCLPDFFEGYTFGIDPHIQDRGFDVNLLKRYVTAYSGEVVEHIHEDSNVDYVLSLSGECALRRAGGGAVVRPDWVWRCNDHNKKVSTKDFLIK